MAKSDCKCGPQCICIRNTVGSSISSTGVPTDGTIIRLCKEKGIDSPGYDNSGLPQWAKIEIRYGSFRDSDNDYNSRVRIEVGDSSGIEHIDTQNYSMTGFWEKGDPFPPKPGWISQNQGWKPLTETYDGFMYGSSKGTGSDLVGIVNASEDGRIVDDFTAFIRGETLESFPGNYFKIYADSGRFGEAGAGSLLVRITYKCAIWEWEVETENTEELEKDFPFGHPEWYKLSTGQKIGVFKFDDEFSDHGIKKLDPPTSVNNKCKDYCSWISDDGGWSLRYRKNLRKWVLARKQSATTTSPSPDENCPTGSLCYFSVETEECDPTKLPFHPEVGGTSQFLEVSKGYAIEPKGCPPTGPSGEEGGQEGSSGSGSGEGGGGDNACESPKKVLGEYGAAFHGTPAMTEWKQKCVDDGGTVIPPPGASDGIGNYICCGVPPDGGESSSGPDDSGGQEGSGGGCVTDCDDILEHPAFCVTEIPEQSEGDNNAFSYEGCYQKSSSNNNKWSILPDVRTGTSQTGNRHLHFFCKESSENLTLTPLEGGELRPAQANEWATSASWSSGLLLVVDRSTHVHTGTDLPFEFTANHITKETAGADSADKHKYVKIAYRVTSVASCNPVEAGDANPYFLPSLCMQGKNGFRLCFKLAGFTPWFHGTDSAGAPGPGAPSPIWSPTGTKPEETLPHAGYQRLGSTMPRGSWEWADKNVYWIVWQDGPPYHGFTLWSRAPHGTQRMAGVTVPVFKLGNLRIGYPPLPITFEGKQEYTLDGAKDCLYDQDGNNLHGCLDKITFDESSFWGSEPSPKSTCSSSVEIECDPAPGQGGNSASGPFTGDEGDTGDEQEYPQINGDNKPWRADCPKCVIAPNGTGDDSVAIEYEKLEDASSLGVSHVDVFGIWSTGGSAQLKFLIYVKEITVSGQKRNYWVVSVYDSGDKKEKELMAVHDQNNKESTAAYLTKNHRCPNLTNSTKWFPAGKTTTFTNFLIKPCPYQGPAPTEPDASTGNPNNSDNYFAGSSDPGNEDTSGDPETTKNTNQVYPCPETLTPDEVDLNDFVCVSNVLKNGISKSAYNGTYKKTSRTSFPEKYSSHKFPIYEKSDVCKENVTDSDGNRVRIRWGDITVGIAADDEGKEFLIKVPGWGLEIYKDDNFQPGTEDLVTTTIIYAPINTDGGVQKIYSSPNQVPTTDWRSLNEYNPEMDGFTWLCFMNDGGPVEELHGTYEWMGCARHELDAGTNTFGFGRETWRQPRWHQREPLDGRELPPDGEEHQTFNFGNYRMKVGKGYGVAAHINVDYGSIENGGIDEYDVFWFVHDWGRFGPLERGSIARKPVGSPDTIMLQSNKIGSMDVWSDMNTMAEVSFWGMIGAVGMSAALLAISIFIPVLAPFTIPLIVGMGDVIIMVGVAAILSFSLPHLFEDDDHQSMACAQSPADQKIWWKGPSMSDMYDNLKIFHGKCGQEGFAKIRKGVCCSSDNCKDSLPPVTETNPIAPEYPSVGSESSSPPVVPTEGGGEGLSPGTSSGGVGSEATCEITKETFWNHQYWCVTGRKFSGGVEKSGPYCLKKNGNFWRVEGSNTGVYLTKDESGGGKVFKLGGVRSGIETPILLTDFNKEDGGATSTDLFMDIPKEDYKWTIHAISGCSNGECGSDFEIKCDSSGESSGFDPGDTSNPPNCESPKTIVDSLTNSRTVEEFTKQCKQRKQGQVVTTQTGEFETLHCCAIPGEAQSSPVDSSTGKKPPCEYSKSFTGGIYGAADSTEVQEFVSKCESEGGKTTHVPEGTGGEDCPEPVHFHAHKYWCFKHTSPSLKPPNVAERYCLSYDNASNTWTTTNGNIVMTPKLAIGGGFQRTVFEVSGTDFHGDGGPSELISMQTFIEGKWNVTPADGYFWEITPVDSCNVNQSRTPPLDVCGEPADICEASSKDPYTYCCKELASSSISTSNNALISGTKKICIEGSTTGDTTKEICGAAYYFRGCYSAGYEHPKDCSVGCLDLIGKTKTGGILSLDGTPSLCVSGMPAPIQLEGGSDEVMVAGCYATATLMLAAIEAGQSTDGIPSSSIVWVHAEKLTVDATNMIHSKIANGGTYIICMDEGLRLYYNNTGSEKTVADLVSVGGLTSGKFITKMNTDFANNTALFGVVQSNGTPAMYSVKAVESCTKDAVDEGYSCGPASDFTTDCDKSSNNSSADGSPWIKTDGSDMRVVYEDGVWKLYGPTFEYKNEDGSDTGNKSTLYATSNDNKISDGITGWTPTDELLRHSTGPEKVCADYSFGKLRLRATGNQCCPEMEGDEATGGIPPEQTDNGEDSSGNPVDTGESSGKPNTYGQNKDCVAAKFDFSLKGGCGTDNAGAGLQPLPVDNLVPHFQLVTGGVEFDTSKLVQRINKETHGVFRYAFFPKNGTHDADDIKSLKSCVSKLNELIHENPNDEHKGPKIIYTKPTSQYYNASNVFVIVATRAELEGTHLPALAASQGGNLNMSGYAFPPAGHVGYAHRFATNCNIGGGWIWINSEVVMDGDKVMEGLPAGSPVRRSFIWEESTQIIGYGHDVEKYCDGREATDSMFYQHKYARLGNEAAQGFSEEDAYAIKTLYKSYVIPCQSDVENARLVRKEEKKEERPCWPNNQSQQQATPNNFSPCACYEFATAGCDSTGQALRTHHTTDINGGTTGEGNSNKDLVTFGNAQNPKGYKVYEDGEGHYSEAPNVSAVFDGTAYHTSKDVQKANLCWNMFDSHGGTWGRGVGPPFASAQNYPHTHGHGVAVSFWFKRTGSRSGKVQGVITHGYGMGQRGEYPSTAGGWGIFYKDGKLIFVVSNQGDSGFEYVSAPAKQGDTEYGFVEASDEWTHYFFWHNSNDKAANEANGGEGKNGIIAVISRVKGAPGEFFHIAPVDGEQENVVAAPDAEFIIGANKFNGSTEILNGAEIDTVKIYDNVAEFDKMDEMATADYNDGKGACCIKSIYCNPYEAGGTSPVQADAASSGGGGVGGGESGPSFVYNGYYPVFRTSIEAKMASPNHTSDDYIINGQRIYMPGGLVMGETIFYGDYGFS